MNKDDLNECQVIKDQEFNVSYPDDLFTHLQKDQLIKFLGRTEDLYLVYGNEVINKVHKHLIFESTVLKTVKDRYLKVFDKVYYTPSNKNYNIKQISDTLTYRDEYMFTLSANCCSIDPNGVVEDTIREIIEKETVLDTKSNEVAISVPDINTSRKSKHTRVKSFVYANIEHINDIKTFIEMRILEFEDQKGYDSILKSALDYVFVLVTNPKYRLGPKRACEESAKKYKLPLSEIKSGNQARRNIRRSCRKLWEKKNASHI